MKNLVKNITKPNLSGCQVHEIIENFIAENIEIPQGYNSYITIMRGGALLESSLPLNKILRINPKTLKVTRTDQNRINEANRILLCDVIMDTGKTFITVFEFLKKINPQLKIDIFSVFATEVSLKLLKNRDVNNFIILDYLNGGVSKAFKPLDIPYDFGEVADECKLCDYA